MFLIGNRQALKAVKRVDFGMYFAEDGHEDERVLLPKKEVPEDLKTGDTLELFLYKDSNDRLIATRRNPKICVGNIALLRVSQVSKIGAFLDWGLGDLGWCPRICFTKFTKSSQVMPNAAGLGTKYTLIAIDIELLNCW